MDFYKEVERVVVLTVTLMKVRELRFPQAFDLSFDLSGIPEYERSFVKTVTARTVANHRAAKRRKRSILATNLQPKKESSWQKELRLYPD